MSKKHKSGIGEQLKESGPSRRSELHRWLRQHYNELAPVLNIPAPQWNKAAALVTERGVTGSNGKPPSAKSLRQMWLRLVRDVENERARRAAAKSVKPTSHRSRQSPTWKPPVAQPRADPRNFAGDRPTAPAASAQRLEKPRDDQPKRRITRDDLSPEQRTMLENVMEEMRAADRKRAGNF